MLAAIRHFNDEAFDALEAGVPVEEIIDIDAVPRLNRMNTQADWESYIEELEADVTDQLRELY